MKIVHLIMMFQTGGAETMLVDIVNEQIKGKHDISLIIMNEDVKNSTLLEQLNRKIRVFYLHRPRSSKNPWYVLKLNALLWSLSPDVVHCHNPVFTDYLYAVPYSKIFATVHSIGYEYEKFRKISRINKIFAISHLVKTDIDQRYGSEKYPNVVVVENGICTDSILHKTDYSTKQGFKIVMVSRLNLRQKSQEILIQAVARLIRSNHKGIYLDLIGGGDDATTLHNLVNDLGISEHVKFHGDKSRSYIYCHLKDYNLLVQSSKIEGFGLTVAEGLAAGLPVLVSDNGGPMEIIDGGKFGFYFKTGNVQDCAEQIERIMNLPEKKITELGRSGIKRAEKYSVENMIKSYYHYYNAR